MIFQYTSITDATQQLLEVPSEFIRSDTHGKTEVHAIGGSFGEIQIYESNAGPYSLFKENFVIEKKFSVNKKTDREFLCVLLIQKGNGTFNVPGIGNLTLKEGQFQIFYSPSGEIATSFEDKGKLEIVQLFFTINFLEDISVLFPVIDFIYKVKTNKADILQSQAGWVCNEILSTITYLFDCPHDGEIRLYYFSRKITDLIFYLLKQMFYRGTEPITNQQYQKIMEIKYYVEVHVGAILTTEQVAANFNLELHKLIADFDMIMGITLSKFILKARLNNAKQLLLGSEKTITEIAFICGYTHVENFVTAFKQFFDITPLALRNKAKGIF